MHETVKKLFLLFMNLPFLLNSQTPIAEFEFNENIDDTYENFTATGLPIYNADKTALEFSKDYEILIDPFKDLDAVNLTTQISFLKKSNEIPIYGLYAIEGLLYKGTDTEVGNRQMSIYISGEESPFNLYYLYSNAGKFESLGIHGVIEHDVLYNLHFVQTIDSLHVYNNCDLLGKGLIDASDIDYNDENLRLGMIPSPKGIFITERALYGEIHLLRFYDIAMTTEQIEQSCILSGVKNSEEVEDQEFSIFPNPSTGFFILKSNAIGQYYRVYDIAGKVIISGNIISLETQLDLTNFNNGVYSISVISKSDKHSSKRILKIQ